MVNAASPTKTCGANVFVPGRMASGGTSNVPDNSAFPKADVANTVESPEEPYAPTSKSNVVVTLRIRVLQTVMYLLYAFEFY